MLRLNDLRDKPRSSKNRKRVGRGPRGKRPGHGGKGQTARSGVALGNFQGGQNPIERRLPKQRSFFTGEGFATVALNTLERLITNGKISADIVIDSSVLKDLKVVSNKHKKFKVVGSTDLKMTLEAHAISEGARKSIEKASGEVRIIS